MDPVFNRYLKKGVVGCVIACGHSIYTYSDETDSLSVLVDGDEWCLVDVKTPIPDFDYSEGWVKAEDLRELSDRGLGLDSFLIKERGLRI